jgi:hypothetical protein
MLEKSAVGLKKHLVKITLALLVLSIITSTITLAPITNAQGFPHVPTLSPSTPTPTPSPTPTQSASASPSPSPTEFPWNFSTNAPTKSPTVEGAGFWSLLTIGIVVVALVAFAVPATFFYLRRGKGKMLLDEEQPINTQELPAASNRPAESSRYSQSSYQSSYQSKMPAKPTEPSRYGQPPSYGYRQQQSSSSVAKSSSTESSSYSRPAPYTKICPNCKRSVRNDQNICPYCDKRLK